MPQRSSRFRGRGISQAQRRKKTWLQVSALVGAGQSSGLGGSLQFEVTTPTQIGSANRDGFIAMSGDGTGDSSFEGSIPSESTILRIRGSLAFPANLPRTIGNLEVGDNQFNFGIGVSSISDNQATSYPAPISDSDWDGWMFLRQSAVADITYPGSVVDVKAMRKINDGEALFIMAEGLTGSSAGTSVDAEWLFDLRVLLLLP